MHGVMPVAHTDAQLDVTHTSCLGQHRVSTAATSTPTASADIKQHWIAYKKFAGDLAPWGECNT